MSGGDDRWKAKNSKEKFLSEELERYYWLAWEGEVSSEKWLKQIKEFMRKKHHVVI